MKKFYRTDYQNINKMNLTELKAQEIDLLVNETENKDFAIEGSYDENDYVAYLEQCDCNKKNEGRKKRCSRLRATSNLVGKELVALSHDIYYMKGKYDQAMKELDEQRNVLDALCGNNEISEGECYFQRAMLALKKHHLRNGLFNDCRFALDMCNERVKSINHNELMICA